MGFSEKQKAFFRAMDENHRWNIKQGATRSGKTYMDYFVIPMRIRACGRKGLIVLCGNTTGTLDRNIITPMRDLWGDAFVGPYRPGGGSVKLFGRTVQVFGADNAGRAQRIQGASFQYCYGDEITTWNEDFFQMVKTRLSEPNSRFDGTCNPAGPSHWFKTFLDSDADIYAQSYTLDDNPFTPQEYKDSLKKELAGTVYFDRFVLGKWVAAEGIIYQTFSADPYMLDIDTKTIRPDEFIEINMGVDFGGTKSGTAFVTTGVTEGYENVIVLQSRLVQTAKEKSALDPDHLNRLFLEYAREILLNYGRLDNVYCDNAETILITGMRRAAETASLPCTVRNAQKIAINDRIRLTSGLISEGRLRLTDNCESLRKAMAEALWNDKKHQDERLDDGTTDIDTLDAFEYSIERNRRELLQNSFWGTQPDSRESGGR